MQTKKRAKSVSFGKKETPKEKHEVKEHKPAAHHVDKPKVHPEEDTKIEIETVETEVSVLEAPEEEVDSDSIGVEEQVPHKKESAIREVEEEHEPEPEEEEVVEERVESPKEKEEEITFDENELEEESPREKSAFSSDTREEEKGPKNNFFLYFLIVALVSFVIGLLCMAGIDYIGSNKPTDINSFLNAPTSTPAPTKAPVASPTPAKTVDVSSYNIQVLNGSGIKGEAAKLREGLVGEGFKVSTSGNAATQDYEMTELSVKKNVSPEYVAKLKKFLQDQSYTVEEFELPDSAKTDVVVTIGQQ